ncbi:MAG: pullulanase-type alpha-1,6-glucosidase [Ardenticatenaceae bacterium]|nr:pullulanase-type alpha-1,6-glucosidase [Ardenticatenaceae bacterium]MCB8991979.1 pullulanase-type alpha-1,6-glucosidase [Ardenticatenaceae bacterium]MCB9004918.1 pullulanase-type alpha-1,6-glucosidase [Ardenticatenaceae bacterium]
MPGDFQDELGCPGDWQPECLRTWLQDPDGDGTYIFVTDQIPAGDYEAKVAINLGWTENYGDGGAQDGANIAFSVPNDGELVTFAWNSTSKALDIGVGAGAGPVGNLKELTAHWVSADTIAWNIDTEAATSYRFYYSPTGAPLSIGGDGITGGEFLTLTLDPNGLSEDVLAKFPHLHGYAALKFNPDDFFTTRIALKGPIAIGAAGADGPIAAAGIQIPGVLDDLFSYDGPLGPTYEEGVPVLRVWAPTARAVSLKLFDDAASEQAETLPMRIDSQTGVWSITGTADWDGKYYLYEVQVFAPTTGNVETNLVTDPYSVSLAANSSRSQIINLDDPATMPDGWADLRKTGIAAPEDIVIYELHIRDFSAFDESVPEEERGTYLAFTHLDSDGMTHLAQLADAGLTHLHLLPSFDIATINETRSEWVSPDPATLAALPPDSEEQQTAVEADANSDGFNWGYDPYHYNVPEGSYSTDPNGPARIVEYRQMVQSLNDIGLYVVADVVYNHTNASGQSPKSVLDQIVPGYYHRLNDKGRVENSTCCQNTATEHDMMRKLMVDSVVLWAKAYKIDAFRFDLMGHHMKEDMLAVRAALDALTLEADGVDGKSIYLYGEGWNFGEVASNARGVNATQANMAGTGIGTFNDRLRDAVRGGSPFDGGQDLLRQGFANGLFYDPNALEQVDALGTLLQITDWVRIGLAGNLTDYEFVDGSGNRVTGAVIDYNGNGAGYTADPQENLVYISKHDNQTLYDNNAYRLPVGTSMADRIRVQNVGLSTVMFAQGVPFFQAGSDMLRSKSLDRDSFNSGDWFNAIDWSYNDTDWGHGLPVASKNKDNWSIMQPLLADPTLDPTAADVALMTQLFGELLQIRQSSPLFRLQTAVAIQDRLAFHNTGPDQMPGLIVMSLSDMVGDDLDANYDMVAVLFNANDEAAAFSSDAFAGMALELHPVQQNSVDEVVKTAVFDPDTATFSIPARTTAVFVLPQGDVVTETEPAPEPTAEVEMETAVSEPTPEPAATEAAEPVTDTEPAPEDEGTNSGVLAGAGVAVAAGAGAAIVAALRRRKK